MKVAPKIKKVPFNDRSRIKALVHEVFEDTLKISYSIRTGFDTMQLNGALFTLTLGNKKFEFEEIKIDNNGLFSDKFEVKDGFYLIVEKAIPNIVLVVDPTTRTTSHKTKGYNYDFVYVLKYDLDANLQWQNCLEMSFDYKPKYFIDLVCVATDPLPNVKLGYIGVSFVTSKAFDASGEVVKSASSVDLFNANYRGSYTEDYQEQSRLIYLSGNTFLGCHYLRKSIELKKYEFE